MQDEFDAEDLHNDKSADYNIFAQGDEISHKTYLVSPFCFKNAVNFINVQLVKKKEIIKEFNMSFLKYDTEKHSSQKLSTLIYYTLSIN